MIKISPSLLSADFAHLADELHAIEKAGADMLHLDIMDGVYVPNISLGVPVVESLRKVTGLFFDVHLMIHRPLQYVDAFAAAGADMITFHIESQPDETVATIERIRAAGKKVGVTLNPGTPIERLLPFIPMVDLALIMTVEPGFGGQKFMPDMMAKVAAVREEAKRLGKEDLIIQVDGGVNVETSAICAANGANCLVAGSAVFGKPDYAAAISGLRNAAMAAVVG